MNIELEITLKCNASCLNCNKFCNMQDLGIVYGDELDLTLEDVDKFIQQVKNIGNVKNIRIMGGEPTVHPLFNDICKMIKTKLVDTKLVKRVYVVTNGLKKIDCCLELFVQLPYKVKPVFHTCALVSPADIGIPYRDDICPTPRVWGVSYNKLGWYPCGPGGAIARLFKLDHIRKDTIRTTNDWGNSIFEVCSRCQNFGKDRIFEKTHGRPISSSYEKAIEEYIH